MKNLGKLLFCIPVLCFGAAMLAGCNKDEAADNPPAPVKPAETPGAAGAGHGGLQTPTMNPNFSGAGKK